MTNSLDTTTPGIIALFGLTLMPVGLANFWIDSNLKNLKSKIL